MGRDLLLIAARQPAPGMTKTRLGTTIGMEREHEIAEGVCGSDGCPLPWAAAGTGSTPTETAV